MPERDASARISGTARRYRPGFLALQLPDRVDGLPPALDRPAAPHAQAWICKGSQCLPPVTQPARMIELPDAPEP